MTLAWTLLAAVVWFGGMAGAPAAPQFLRLRNETIDTRSAIPVSTVVSVAEVSGLRLIQFAGPVEPAWREAVAARGVDLLSYVPDYGFVARFNQVDLGELQSLPFVHWTGPYRPEHKIHRDLALNRAGRPAEELEAVTVLVAPRAPAVEVMVVRSSFQSLQQESTLNFGTVLRGRLPFSRLAAVAGLDAVLWIEPAPRMKLFDQIASGIVAGQGLDQSTFTQDLGLTGAGVTVAVADSGLHTGRTNDMHPDLAGRVLAFFHYGDLDDASDEHSHGTHVAGIIAGDGATGEADDSGALYGLGVAPEACIVAQRLFDGVGNYESPPSFEVLTHDAVRAGADIGSNSWGDDTQGRYDVSAAEFDALVRDADAGTAGEQQYVLECSAGNAGPGTQTIGSPAVAKNVIATGASQNNRFEFMRFDEGEEAMAGFSSRGPAEDGRIKPDVVAPGTWIASLRSAYADDNNAWAAISQNYLYQGGTSQAGPHVAGAAAVFMQYYRETFAIGEPSPALVKAALIHSASDLDDSYGTGPVPNNDEGWGRVDLVELIASESTYELVDQTERLTLGQSYERPLVIASSDRPLKLTLVYTDYPGFPGVLPALVNDLDLELIAPDGRVYRGNQFDPGGRSVPDAPTPDNLNNVEGIYIELPPPGEYRVRVVARNIAQDAVPGGVPDQDFALVLSGDIPPMEAGTLFLDRSAYRAPGLIQLKLIDADLAGTPDQLITIRSATEPGGLTVLLLPAGTPGSFTGAVATALGPATADGALQMAHGDWIRAEYYDVTYATWRHANAVGDLVPPMITGVTVTNRYGQTFVTWLTDEPANALVRFNTNANLSRMARDPLYRARHEVELTNLVIGATYQYRAESTDIAGNTATNHSQGTNFTFLAEPTATVLLVNNYVDQPSADIIPVSTYTDALSQIGVSYDVWHATNAGAPLPTIANLRSYKAVMWRVNDASLAGSSESIPTGQQAALQQYLAGGGSFFMASMEILSRLGPVPFRTNVLRVQQFQASPDPFNPCANCDEHVGVPGVEGENQDPISNGMLVGLDYGQYPAIPEFGVGPDRSDTFTPATNCTPILFSTTNGRVCGIRFPRTGQDSTGRVVFCSFPFDALPASGPPPNNRASFLRGVIEFLIPGLNGLGTIVLNQTDYSLPDLVVVEVSDGTLTGLPGPVVHFHSDTAPMPVQIQLQETVQPGLFRGFIPLAAATNPPAPGLLRATHGDRIYARYYAVTGSIILEAEAEVDNVPPLLVAGPTILRGYDDASLEWETDEPTDALVQYGEGTVLSRTAYSADLNFTHAIRVRDLLPDRLYSYQVVSRDAAGNTRVGPHGTFRTLLPEQPDWTADFEDGPGTWSVLNGEDSTAAWSLGQPNNGNETAAHSPPNCWGSSRLGDAADTIDTFLVSPAIALTGGNVARLKFWHQWDFTQRTTFDVSEFGQLLVFTNSRSDPAVLAVYQNLSQGWESEEINLTPFIGSVVRLVWHHQLLAFESASRPGWLVDDVQVTITNLPPVTLRITNNLAQARWILHGPGGRTGQGYDTWITNAPPDEYAVVWNPVAYYVTPAAQTNSVPAGGSQVFTGLYTFPDVNTNSISDIWEQQYWGGAFPQRTRDTDSDQDGFTDHAEFIAGTNPTLANSHLRVTTWAAQPSGALLLHWPTVAGRIYQVQTSSGFDIWAPITGWIQASGSLTSVSVPAPAPVPGQPHVYRVEVRP